MIYFQILNPLLFHNYSNHKITKQIHSLLNIKKIAAKLRESEETK